MIVIRTNASATIGFGHLKRCAYLASLLKKKTDILFCVNKDKSVSRFLEDLGATFCRNSAKEFRQLKTLHQEKHFKCIIFDLRDFSPEDFQLLEWAKGEDITTIQLTDLGLSRQAVDIIVDPTVEKLFPYTEDETPRLLDGPDYALLHHRYRHFNKVRRKYRKNVRNLLISLGGGVQYRQLKKLVNLLSRHRFQLKIAAGFYLTKGNRKTLKRIYPGIRFVGKTDTLARAFFEADAALITAGTAVMEAAATGTPTLYFYYHDEQKFIAQSYADRGAGLVMTKTDNIVEETVIESLNSLTLDKRIEMGRKGKQLVDGLGACRIVTFIEQQVLT